ncbi:MAG: class II glutamine amidotransferase, partial [Oceanospirillum sp.]|nr:class II glutamine amidotransferase [Oceanospirillum sp.]
MCGIVGAVAQRPVSGILLEGLRRLEYRGYDSAGLAVIEGEEIQRLRRAGKVENLTQAEQDAPLKGFSGIAHTRWATHGKPTENNAHPHMSGDDLAIVHNGIIENFEPLKKQLQSEGFVFTSDTDTEVIAHLVARAVGQGKSLQDAFLETVSHLEGAFALGVLHKDYPNQILASRKGSP